MSCGTPARLACVRVQRRGGVVRPGWGVALGIVLALLWPSAAFAHRPNESSAVLRWDHGRLEGTVTLPLALATRVLDDPEVFALRPENFAASRARLTERLLAGLTFSIAGRAVRPTETVLELDRAGEVQATLVFPPCDPAALEVRAEFLTATPFDAFCLVRVWEGADRLFATRLLVRGDRRAEFAAPTPADPAAPAVSREAAPAPRPPPPAPAP